MIDKDFLNDIEEQQAIKAIVALGLANKEVSTPWRRKLVSATAMVAVGLLVFGLTFPALAGQIPLIGGLFSRVDLHEQARLVGLGDYANVVDKTQVSGGVAITLSEYFFDGEQIYLTYLLESDDVVVRDALFSVDSQMQLVVDGRQTFADFSFTTHGLDDYASLVVVNVAAPAFVDIEDALTIEVIVSVRQLETINETAPNGQIIASGQWDFKIPVTASAPRNNFAINQAVNNDASFDFTIDSLTVSPAFIRLNLTDIVTTVNPWIDVPLTLATNETYETETTNIEFKAADNLGNPVLWLGNEFSGDAEAGQLSFSPPGAGATQIIITPVLSTTSHVVRTSTEDAELLADERRLVFSSGQQNHFFVAIDELVQSVELAPIIIDLP